MDDGYQSIGGSGTLLMDPRVVVLNEHQVTNVHPETNKQGYATEITVEFGYNHGRSIATRRGTVVHLCDPTITKLSHDCAIAVLSSPAPPSITPMALGVFSTKEMIEMGERLSQIGYAWNIENGQVASISEKCSVDGERFGAFKHSCDTWWGASGGPIVAPHKDWCVMAALNRGPSGGEAGADLMYNDNTSNLAVKASVLKDALFRILAELKAGRTPPKVSVGR
jgi:V8-like Glu-specific endopeptidase